MKENGKPMKGATNIVAGVTYIYSGNVWLPYPDSASELISMATDHGWGFDDGLPPRTDVFGHVFVRILIGREAGENALTQDAAPGVQFHITWRAPHPITEPDRERWSLGGIYMKTSDTSGWAQLRSLKDVRSRIASEPVKVPTGYVPISA